MILDRKIFQEICNRVVSVNPAIRFTGIADGDGELLAFSERKALLPLAHTGGESSIRDYCRHETIYKA